jgi:hypothetical protein
MVVRARDNVVLPVKVWFAADDFGDVATLRARYGLGFHFDPCQRKEPFWKWQAPERLACGRKKRATGKEARQPIETCSEGAAKRQSYRQKSSVRKKQYGRTVFLASDRLNVNRFKKNGSQKAMPLGGAGRGSWYDPCNEVEYTQGNMNGFGTQNQDCSD